MRTFLKIIAVDRLLVLPKSILPSMKRHPYVWFIYFSTVNDRISISDNNNNINNNTDNANANTNTPRNATSNINYSTFNVTDSSTST